jgi:hypothetical protein
MLHNVLFLLIFARLALPLLQTRRCSKHTSLLYPQLSARGKTENGRVCDRCHFQVIDICDKQRTLIVTCLHLWLHLFVYLVG